MNEKNLSDVDCVLRAKLWIMRLSDSKKNKSYKNLVEYLDNYLVKYCKHNIISDTIDITPDLSKEIHYCTLCLNTF